MKPQTDKPRPLYRWLVALPLGLATGAVAIVQTTRFSCGDRLDCIPIFELALGVLVAWVCTAWLSRRMLHLISTIVGFGLWFTAMRLVGPNVCPNPKELCGGGFVLALGALAAAAAITLTLSKALERAPLFSR